MMLHYSVNSPSPEANDFFDHDYQIIFHAPSSRHFNTNFLISDMTLKTRIARQARMSFLSDTFESENLVN